MLSAVYAVVVCLSVCLSHSGIVSKRLNVGSAVVKAGTAIRVHFTLTHISSFIVLDFNVRTN